MKCFFKSAFHQKMESIPVVSGGIVRINLDCSSMLCFRYCPIEVMTGYREPECTVGLGCTGIELDSFACRLFSRRGAFGKRFNPEDTQPVVIISDARIGECVIRVE